MRGSVFVMFTSLQLSDEHCPSDDDFGEEETDAIQKTFAKVYMYTDFDSI